MAYTTPTYDYGRQANDLTTNKGLQDNAQDYGRFLSQERFRRGLGDANRSFKQNFPKIGAGFNARGIYNSGLRKQGQQQEAEEYQRGVTNAQFEQGARETQFEQQRTMGNAQYQQALQTLFENMQRARATQFDPYAGVGGFVNNGN
jgi:hypothetical protein